MELFHEVGPAIIATMAARRTLSRMYSTGSTLCQGAVRSRDLPPRREHCLGGADRDWCSVWSSKPVCPAETRVGGFDSHTPPPLAARGQTSHGIRGALHLRWTASRARPYCNSRFTMCNPWFTMPVSLASLCVLLGPIALRLLALRRALPAERFAPLGARARSSTGCLLYLPPRGEHSTAGRGAAR